MIGTKMLIIDSDSASCEMLKIYFKNEGYEVVEANDGISGLNAFKKYDPDIILTDIILAKKDGNDVIREIRAVSNKPIIVISAKGDTFDKVLSLELGADDYLVRPFDVKELGARVKAILRRSGSLTGRDKDILRFDNLEINLTNHEIKIKGEHVDIPHKELMLLHFLAQNYNRVYSRDQLLNKVWSFDYLGDSRTVDVHIKRLRVKLDGVSKQWEIKTVWGVGYKFEVHPEVQEGEDK
jgi:DNA-binding response OmpR family regulator